MTTTAIVVAAARGYLDQTLIALDQQRATPARLIVIDASPHGLDSGYDEAAIPDTVAHEIEVFKAPHAKNLGEAIAIAEADGLRIETEWMWLLHDDSPPHPDALGELQRYVATSPKVGIAGCKQVVLEDPTRLISVGVGYTRAGRRVSGIEPGEIDQGQHDHREDVYAVGSAGMLVRTSTWNHLGGMDPELGPFLDGAELARRARLAGQRVVVVPNAIIRHARASLWHGANRDNPHTDGANSFYSRRLATLYFRLITVRLWAFVAIAVGMILGGVLRGVGRVATTQTTLAWKEVMVPFRAVSRVGAIYRARRRISATSTVPRRALNPLLVPRLEVVRGWWHRLRTQRVERRTRVAPSELELAERRLLTQRRRFGLVFTVIGLGAVGAVIGPQVFAGSAFSFPTLYGGALGGLDDSFQQLWARLSSAWDPSGAGAAQPQHPFIAVIAVLATVIGAPFGVSVSSVANVAFLLGVPLAGLTAWFAAGAFARSVLLRMWVAVLWACAPMLTIAITQGRLSALVGHIFLPLVALTLMRACGLNQRDVIVSGLTDAGSGAAQARTPVVSKASGRASTTAAAAAGLMLAVVGASSPILLPALVVLIAVLVGVTRPGWFRTIVIYAPTTVLFLPQLATALRHGWQHLLLSIEEAPIHLTDFGAGDQPWYDQIPWHVLAGAAEPFENPWLGLVVVGVVVVLAVFGLLRGGSAGWTGRMGWFVAGVGVVTAVWADHVMRPPQYDWLGSYQQIPEWSGPAASMVLGGLLISAIAGLSGVYQRITKRPLGITHLGGGLLVVAMVGLIGVGGAGAIMSLSHPAQWQARAFEPLPALGRQMVEDPTRARVLMLAPTDATIVGQTWRSNGPQHLEGSHLPVVNDQAREDLNEILGQLAGGSVTDLGQRLAPHGVGLVLLPSMESPVAAIDPGAREALFAVLDASPDLERVTENAAGALWRVKTPSAQAVFVAGEERIPITSGLIGAEGDIPAHGDEEATIHLAERAHPGWKATIQGQSLRAIDAGWHQAFEVPAGVSGHLTITYDPLPHRLWLITTGVVVGLTVVLALPLRRREVLT